MEELLLNIPNELTEIMLFLLDTPQLMQMRLICKGFDTLICSSALWANRMSEVDPYLEEAESFSSSLLRYRAGWERKKQAGMFSMKYSCNAIVDPEDRFLLTHGGIPEWSSALIDYPRIRRDPNSKRSFVYGISFRILEFQGNAVWGLIPLDDFSSTLDRGEVVCIELSSRAFHLTYGCYFYLGMNFLSSLFVEDSEVEILRSGDRVEFELDVGKQEMTIRAWSTSFPDPSSPGVLVHTISLENNVTYCWAISVGMPGSKYVVDKAWAHE